MKVHQNETQNKQTNKTRLKVPHLEMLLGMLLITQQKSISTLRTENEADTAFLYKYLTTEDYRYHQAMWYQYAMWPNYQDLNFML